jgi:hypothetical protein
VEASGRRWQKKRRVRARGEREREETPRAGARVGVGAGAAAAQKPHSLALFFRRRSRPRIWFLMETVLPLAACAGLGFWSADLGAC